MYGDVHRCSPAKAVTYGEYMLKRILIADDTEAVRHQLRRNLEELPGYEVCREATDGVEAIETVSKLRPDLLVLDLVMPRMNGLEVAAALQAIVPTLPIILFTLYKDAVPEHLARAFGIGAIVSKADRLEVLHSEVRRLTRHVQTASAG